MNISEDIKLVNQVEKLIKQHFKPVKTKKKNIVLLVSGGPDSTAAWHQLLADDSYEVYPLFLTIGHSRFLKKFGFPDLSVDGIQKRKVRDLHKHFKSEFGEKRVKKPYFLHLESGLAPLYLQMSKTLSVTDTFLLNILLDESEYGDRSMYRYPTPVIFYQMGLMYSVYLERSLGIPMCGVATAVLEKDGIAQKAQTDTALKLVSLLGSYLLKHKFEYFSPFYSTNQSRKNKSKSAVLKYLVKKAKVPLNKTWSCHTSQFIPVHCGLCSSCRSRKEAIAKASLSDPTRYYLIETFFKRSFPGR